MIKFHLKWFITCLISNFRTLSFYLMTLLLAFGFILTDGVVSEYSEDTEVLMCPGDSTVGRDCTDRLTAASPDGFIFTECDDPDELMDMIRRNRAECGVVFRDDDGRSVDIYQASGVTSGYVVREIIFPEMYEAGARDRLDTYVKGLDWEDDSERDEAAAYIDEAYSDYLENMDVSIYKVVDSGFTEDTDTEDSDLTREDESADHEGTQDESADRRSTVLRVDALIVLLVLGLCIYDAAGADRGFYSVWKSGSRFLLKLEKVAGTIVMSTIFAAVTAMTVIRFTNIM